MNEVTPGGHEIQGKTLGDTKILGVSKGKEDHKGTGEVQSDWLGEGIPETGENCLEEEVVGQVTCFSKVQ